MHTNTSAHLTEDDPIEGVLVTDHEGHAPYARLHLGPPDAELIVYPKSADQWRRIASECERIAEALDRADAVAETIADRMLALSGYAELADVDRTGLYDTPDHPDADRMDLHDAGFDDEGACDDCGEVALRRSFRLPECAGEGSRKVCYRCAGFTTPTSAREVLAP